MTPYAGFGGEFTLETENVTPDRVEEGSPKGNSGHVTQVQVFRRGHPGACGHVTPGSGFGVWDHRGDWSFETWYRFWEVGSRWRWDM